MRIIGERSTKNDFEEFDYLAIFVTVSGTLKHLLGDVK